MYSILGAQHHHYEIITHLQNKNLKKETYQQKQKKKKLFVIM